jgi:hypothetical protein
LCIFIRSGLLVILARLIELCLNETNNRVRTRTHLSDTRPIQKDLKSGEALLPFLSNTALVYAIRNVQANQKILKLNVTRQHLVSAGDIKWANTYCYKEQKRY